VYENFNAAAAEIRFTGVTAHPMSAKGVLVNPLLMAADYISHFDRLQTPNTPPDAKVMSGLMAFRAIKTAPCCRPAFAISTARAFYAVNSRLATSLKNCRTIPDGQRRIFD
jgi:di/tripeptidase